jgi:hypothetical protein
MRVMEYLLTHDAPILTARSLVAQLVAYDRPALPWDHGSQSGTACAA